MHCIYTHALAIAANQNISFFIPYLFTVRITGTVTHVVKMMMKILTGVSLYLCIDCRTVVGTAILNNLGDSLSNTRFIQV